MPASAIPQELVDYIVDFLHDDPRALAECTLVSRAWLPTARLHLFSTVLITPRNCAALSAHVAAHPDGVAARARAIRVTGEWVRRTVGESYDADDELFTDAGRARRSPHDKVALLVCAVAAHARTPIAMLHLHLRSRDLAVYHRALVAAPSFAHVTVLTLHTGRGILDHVHVVPVLCAFPRLRRLALHSSEGVLVPFPHSVHTLSRAMHTLTLDAAFLVRPVLDWLLLQGVPAMRTVCIPSMALTHRPSARTFLHALGPSLNHLFIGAYIVGDLDLSTCHELRTLSLIFQFLGPKASIAPYLRGVALAAALPHIETVTLDFSLADRDRARELLASLAHEGLDALLDSFPALRRVRVLAASASDPTENAAFVRTQLPACVARGLLVFPPPHPRMTFGV